MKRLTMYLLLLCTMFTLTASTPQITIVLVIDQCAYRVLEKVRPFLKKGLRFFLDEGVCYSNAYVPYAWPATATGHASLSSGTLPSMHGIVNNEWCTPDGTRVDCDNDSAERAAVFGPQGLQPYGKSSHHLMVDTLSDQLMLQKQAHKHYTVCSVGLKSRATICTAGKTGKAIWFDERTGLFTSSKAYFNTLPQWIRTFNQRHPIRPYTWTLRHQCLPAAYRFPGIDNYRGCRKPASLIGKTLGLKPTEKKPYADILLSPKGNQLVLDCALSCIDAHFCKENNDEKLFMWVLLGSLDKLGHTYGSNTIEVIDMLYHLDYQIKRFMDCVNNKTRKRNILWALTSDHGIAPSPEQMQCDGYSSARRIMGPPIVSALNAALKQTFALDDIALHMDGTYLYVRQDKIDALDKKKQRAVNAFITAFVQNQEGIKKVWRFKELERAYYPESSIEHLYKNQLYAGRSGSFIVQALPYNMITDRAEGISHNSPYNYNTHIPLIIYQRAEHQRKVIDDRVYNTQLAPTLAYLLDVPKPSACTTNILPGIIYKEDCCF